MFCRSAFLTGLFFIMAAGMCEGSAWAAPAKEPAKPAAVAEKQETRRLPIPTIAIVDVQLILQDSVAAKGVQQQLEVQRSKFQSEIAHEETSLRQAEQELSRARGNVAADVFAEREQKLRQKFIAVEKRVQVKRKSLDQAFSESMNVVKKNLQEIVAAVAKERGVNLVIVKQQALWSDEMFDVTDEVLARLNKDLPQVNVKISEVENLEVVAEKPENSAKKAPNSNK